MGSHLDRDHLEERRQEVMKELTMRAELWIRDIVEQCREAGVPCFVKQLGNNSIHFDDGGISGNERNDCPYWTKNRKGGNPDEWPEDLRVREFPRQEAATR